MTPIGRTPPRYVEATSGTGKSKFDLKKMIELKDKEEESKEEEK